MKKISILICIMILGVCIISAGCVSTYHGTYTTKEYDDRIAELINEERDLHGLVPLEYSDKYYNETKFVSRVNMNLLNKLTSEGNRSEFVSITPKDLGITGSRNDKIVYSILGNGYTGNLIKDSNEVMSMIRDGYESEKSSFGKLYGYLGLSHYKLSVATVKSGNQLITTIIYYTQPLSIYPEIYEYL